jgi:serine phosphatase RsbU (regulator of sigma subunit)
MAGDPRFDLDALMIPARQIGGDLFDFFKMDADHLFFTVGDVSGKGMPAALFMALGKSLCKSCALRGETDIGAIIDRANREIARDNSEMLFITLFAGILNLATGELRFCNAGHDAPFLLRKGEAPHSLESVGGPPLCILEDFSWPAERFQLQPGDMLCVITDGITEAMTVAGAVMGRERAQTVLAALPSDTGPAAATRALHEAVDAYVAGAEPSDDLTILAVRWRGPTGP